MDELPDIPTEAPPDDPFVTEGVAPPWRQLYNSLGVGEEFSHGARKCAGFVRAVEEHAKLPELFVKLLDPSIPSKWFEYVLFCLLDTSTPYTQIAKQVLRLKCLRRLLMRSETTGNLSEGEEQIVSELSSRVSIGSVEELYAWAFRIRDFVSTVAQSNDLSQDQRGILAFLIRSEKAALDERVRRISDTIDVYNIKEMARILPHVKTFDENGKDAADLAEAIEKSTPLSRRMLTFEVFAKVGSLEEWIRPLRRDPRLEPLHRLFTAQRTKLASTRSLVALASLHRWIDEAQGRDVLPLWLIERAVAAYQGESFSVDAGRSIELIRGFVETAGAWIEGTTVSGNFSDKLYSQWIGPDMLTRPCALTAAAHPDPHLSIRDIVAAHVGNDRLIDRLLDVSRVYETGGLVEFIATRSHSVNVLSKIASRPFLYAGAANKGVPKALLRSPAAVPLDRLRHFLKPSFFPPSELSGMLRAGGLRSEVATEIRSYLAQ